MNNISIAILTQVNQLLERYGLGACDAVVALYDNMDGTTRLSFEVLPEGDGHARGERVMKALGLSPTSTSVVGSDQAIYATLKEATRLAPPRRPRA